MRPTIAVSGVTISLSSVEDGDEIKEVLYRSWLSTYISMGYGVTAEDIKDFFENQPSVRRPDREPITVVAKKGGEIVGIFCFVKLRDRNFFKAMYILPEYRYKGVGFLLWSEAKKHLDLTKPSYLEVASYNHRAIKLYKKLGFVETGRQTRTIRMKSGSAIPQLEMFLAAQS